jgi:hypothetical protein
VAFVVVTNVVLDVEKDTRNETLVVFSYARHEQAVFFRAYFFLLRN